MSRICIGVTIHHHQQQQSDILTYQNSSYGIEIQYPANWTKDEGDFDPQLFSSLMGSYFEVML